MTYELVVLCLFLLLAIGGGIRLLLWATEPERDSLMEEYRDLERRRK